MPQMSRRGFLQLTGGASAALLTQGVQRAAALPANRTHGTIEDVEHVVVLMQENRSFDSYFSSLRGVRGFGDPHPAQLPSGQDVWHQSDGTRQVLPFHPDVPNLGGQYVEDLDHSWAQTHEAFDGGRYDRWLQTKTPATMMYYRRQDIPWYYALADAFTVCDAYHCSLLGPTDPNRYYMWTGWDGNDGSGGGPDLWNAEVGYSWGTYPERLQQAGVSWKIYQDVGNGLDAAGYWGWTSDPYVGNYGDNSLLYFTQYQNAAPGSPLYDRARTGTDTKAGQNLFSILRSDVAGGTLPQVSWVVAPEAYTEHGNWPVNPGMWYAANVLDALTSNPEVWAKTALFLVYDENDGFFDHLVPPHPNNPLVPGASTVSTRNEFYAGAKDVPGNFGLGVRVPSLVISPWSTGGWVCSETFDHTSLIRFMEKRFSVTEPNISDWRRSVCGDLTSAFDFGRSASVTPSLPSAAGLAPTDRTRHPSYVPIPPAQGTMPRQEPGSRPSRALGYRFDMAASVSGSALQVAFVNDGDLGVQVQLRSAAPLPAAPASYTTGAHAQQQATIPVGPGYDLAAHGPDGFFRRWVGTTAAPHVEVTSMTPGSSGDLLLALDNSTGAEVALTVTDAYAAAISVRLEPHERRTLPLHLQHGWYDVSLTIPADPSWVRQLAGRIHTGAAGVSDPQLGR